MASLARESVSTSHWAPAGLLAQVTAYPASQALTWAALVLLPACCRRRGDCSLPQLLPTEAEDREPQPWVYFLALKGVRGQGPTSALPSRGRTGGCCW